MATAPPESLRRRLLVALLLPLIAIAAVGAVYDYLQARELTDDAYDQALLGASLALASRLETDRDDDLEEHLVATMHTMGQADAPDEWHYAIVDGNGQRIAGDPALAVDTALPDGLPVRYRNGRGPDGPTREVVYHHQGKDGEATIVVAEGTDRRQAATRHILASTVWPNVLMVLASLAAVLFAVRHALAPLARLSERFVTQEARGLRPLALRGVPRETLPLVQAVNDLTLRLREAAAAEQAFLNKAAHQLRTPLAGLRTQLELHCADLQGPPRARAETLLASVRRLGRLTHQMLSMARAAPSAAQAQEPVPVDLEGLLETLASERLDAALARGIDLGFEPAPARVRGSAWMLRELLLNLVDNALAHAPAGTAVTVRCGVAEGQAWLEVEDEGPGIPPAQRERVFEPFVRLAEDDPQGSGLGLAIVREIADYHQATVTLGEGAGARGLRARVVFVAEITLAPGAS